MWIDSHCHLDASEFNGQALQLADDARQKGVRAIVIPAVHRQQFAQVIELAMQREDCFFALGIHPLFVATSKEEDLVFLRSELMRLLSEPTLGRRLVAVGEIGLDFFVPELKQTPLREKQEFFYREQLKIARDLSLPVILHVRQAQDQILKYLRQIPVTSGIAHAFNGSLQQAERFIAMGFKLGFGGAMTYTRALQIRRLATQLPLETIVLETDAPDIAPSWCDTGLNTPDQLGAIGAVLADLRSSSVELIAHHTTQNVLAALPRLQLLSSD